MGPRSSGELHFFDDPKIYEWGKFVFSIFLTFCKKSRCRVLRDVDRYLVALSFPLKIMWIRFQGVEFEPIQSCHPEEFPKKKIKKKSEF